MIFSLLLALHLVWAGLAWGAEPPPTRPAPLNVEAATLVVMGKISKPTPVYLDLAALMRLEASVFVMTNRRTGRKDRCRGIAFIDFLNYMGLAPDATHVEVIAANNYKATIRIADLRRYDYLLSYEVNGRLYRDLPPEENKGPVAIAINFDKHPELDWDIYKHQLVWFVKTIVVR